LKYQRPQERYVNVKRVPVEGACPECGEERLEKYQVLSEGGFFDVVKCQSCLASVSREWDPIGPIELLSTGI
jgi:hypothetical protein